MSIEKRRSDVPGLPPGWKKEEISRRSGLSAGRTDVYYFRWANFQEILSPVCKCLQWLSSDFVSQLALIANHKFSSSFIFDFTFSPDGQKIRSKPELARALGENFDLSCFDFRSGKILQSAIRKSKRMRGTTYDYARGALLESEWIEMHATCFCGPCVFLHCQTICFSFNAPKCSLCVYTRMSIFQNPKLK